ncbi:membrane steroid-binding protein 2 [Ricinus communis]|uniref:Steroid binding protein, putative n=1 Tax=Ricinus communis TaxID=3988 RepID=B9SCC9_RICCO|nr:membrane steroid-binding protein 2 [Ricinus communis]EEF38734.1 steroid binding protein, putative [Ricinus communis]|eukprot:XP_002523648.1 membrane steroid-binding protein 2 [Ricinus communis]
MATYSIVMDSIEGYTGLSPAAFFTIAALMVVVYKMVCSMFVDPEELHNHKLSNNHINDQTTPRILEPVQLGDYVTEQELRAYDGSDPSKPLLMAIKGQIYDVSSSRMFYGPGGPYAKFAGRDASRALALLSFDPKDLTGNLEGLSESELEVLQDWEYKFMEKYVKVGQLVSEHTRTEETDAGEKVEENQKHETNGEE